VATVEGWEPGPITSDVKEKIHQLWGNSIVGKEFVGGTGPKKLTLGAKKGG